MKVYIEAGHSPADPGAVVEGVAERPILVALAHRMASLSGWGVEYVPCSRENERNALSRLCARLLRIGPSLVVSFHLNSSAKPIELHQARIYWDGKRPASERLATALRARAIGPQGFAEQAVTVRAPWDRNGKPYTYPVLRDGKEAAALIEFLFLSDAHARAVAQTEAWQQRACRAVDLGVRDWLS